MRIPFEPTKSEGSEAVMDLKGMLPSEIRFNLVTREITLNIADTYTKENIDQMSWQAIKELVLENGGTWTNKKTGIDFMIGKPK